MATRPCSEAGSIVHIDRSGRPSSLPARAAASKTASAERPSSMGPSTNNDAKFGAPGSSSKIAHSSNINAPAIGTRIGTEQTSTQGDHEGRREGGAFLCPGARATLTRPFKDITGKQEAAFRVPVLRAAELKPGAETANSVHQN